MHYPVTNSASNMDSIDLPLDPALRTWVLIPISLATLLMGLIRRNLMIFATKEPSTNIFKVRDANRLKRSANLRRNSSYLSRAQLEARRFYFIRDGGALHMPPKDLSVLTALMNPESMANQVISLFLSIVPSMIMGTVARYMFAGLAVCRLPFTLTPRFRPMLQTGIEMVGQNLDVRYVSSLSWYILNLFGNTALLSLVTGPSDDDMFVPSVASQIALNISPDKVFDKEKQALTKLQYSCKLEVAERELLKVDPSEFSIR